MGAAGLATEAGASGPALSLDATRILEWGFAQAVLWAVWDIEDGFVVRPDNASLQLAVVIRRILGHFG